MRKKRVMLWSLLCGIFLVGGAAYLNKAEPLKAADKSETAQTKQTAPTAKTKAVAKTPAVTQTGEGMVEVGPPDENYSTLPNFNFQQLSGDVDPSNTNRASMPEGYGFVGSRKEERPGAVSFALFARYLPIKQADSTYNTMYGTYNPFESYLLNKQYYAVYNVNFTGDPRPGTNGATEFMWQRLPSPSNSEIADGLAFAYNTFNGNGDQGGLATTDKVVKYNPNEAFGYAYGEYEIGSTDFFDMTWASNEHSPGATKESMIRIWLRAQMKNSIDASDYTVGNITDLASRPVDSFFMGFNKNAFWDQPHESIVDKYFTIYLNNLYKTPIFFRNLMVLMTSVHANPTAIKIPLGKDVVPYLTADALKQTMGDVYYYSPAEDKDYDVDDPQGGVPVNPGTITNLKILSENVPTSDLISKKKLMIQFNYETPDTHETKVGIVPIDFEVTAGNSIFLGGEKTTGTPYSVNENLSSLAFTLNNVGDEATPQYQIAATKGNGPYGDMTFNTKTNAATPYYQVDYFAPPADGETLNLNQDLTTKGTENGSLVAVKDSTPNALISSWGTDGKLDVELGGVLRVYMSDPTKEWLYQNDVLNSQFVPNNLPQKNYVFYQVTENGLEPMYTNQMTLNTPATADRISTGIKTPASILSKLFNESTVANSKYLTPHEGTTLEEYTFVWDFQEGAGTASGQKNILANLVTRKNDLPYVFTVPMKPVVNVTSTEFIPWLPTLNDDSPDKWKDSTNPANVIPGDQTFSVAWFDGVSSVDMSGKFGPDLGFKQGSGMSAPNDPTAGGQISADGKTITGKGMGGPAGTTSKNLLQFQNWGGITNKSKIRFNNVGYYNQQPIDLQVTWQGSNLALAGAYNDPNREKSFIGTGSDFLLFGFAQKNNNGGLKNLTLEVYNHGEYDTPLNVSGYWQFKRIGNNERLQMNPNQIDQIFSRPREDAEGALVENPELIQYSYPSPDQIQFSGGPTGSDPSQLEMTITYKNQTAFEFNYLRDGAQVPASVYFQLGQDTQARVALPAPQVLYQKYDTITEANYPDKNNHVPSPLNEQIVQYIPYMMDAYRPTELTWQLPEPAENAPIKTTSGWTVKGTDGQEIDPSLISINGNTVTADPTKANLYDHYYVFEHNLVIDPDYPVDAEEVKPIDGEGQYYTLTNTASVKTDQGEPITSKDGETHINFAANLPYTYVLKNKNGEDVTPSGYAPDPTANSALITQGYKPDGFTVVNGVINNEDIDYGLIGYKIDGVEYLLNSEDLDTLKIKYTTNPVTLVYQEGAGAVLSFDVTSTLNFGSRTIQAQNDIPQESEWKLLAENAVGYKVTAERTAFTADGVDPLAAKLFLHFEGDEGEPKEVEIPPTTGPILLNKIPLDGSWTIDSDNSTATSKEAGFSLNVPAGNITAGKQYKSEITFTLTDAPSS